MRPPHHRKSGRQCHPAPSEERRVYLVVGRLDRYFPQVEARISCNGRFVTIPVSQIIAPLPMDFPGHWADTVHTGRREVA